MIKVLEASLAQLPETDEDLAPQRETLITKIAQLNSAIPDTIPIGKRIDNAREAVERSQRRGAEARTALERAQQVVTAAEAVCTAADAETAKYAQELADLEAALAPPIPSPPLNSHLSCSSR